MGTISEKLTYLNGTKQLLKDKINNLGGSIDDNTTFRNYANQLQNVYDNLPKTEYVEGSNITLENCLKGKLDIDKLEGDAEQESTNGYQLFDINGTTSGTFVKYNNGFKLTKANNRVLRIALPQTYSAGTYTLSMEQVSHISSVTNYFYVNIQKYTGSAYDSVKDGVIINNNTDIEIEIPSDFNTFYFYIPNGETSTAEVTVDDVMLETGTTAHNWEKFTGGQASPNPTYPQTIKSVTGNQEVVVRGKNLVEGLELGEINAQTGAESPASNIVRTINYIPYSKLKSYRQSVNGENLSSGTNLRFYNKNKEYIGYAVFPTNTSITDISITTGSGVTTTDLEPKYFRIRVGTSVLQTDSKYMIATSNDLTYEPYITPITKQLSLGSIELNKIGTYQDYIYKSNDKWYKHSEIGKHTFNGSENWSITQSGTANWFYTTSNFNTDLLKAFNEGNNQAKSNYYVANTIVSSGTLNGFYIAGSSSNHLGFIRIRYGTEDTPANFKTWLSTHNLEVRYILYEPTDTQITDTTLINQLEEIYQLMSIQGTTIIESNGDLLLIIKARALKAS